QVHDHDRAGHAMRVSERSAGGGTHMALTEWLRLEWDRVAAWGCIAIGALALLLGWFGVSRSPYPAYQLSFILSGGIGGVFLLGLGAMLWLSADLRDEWTKLDRIQEAIERGRTEAVFEEPVFGEPVVEEPVATPAVNGRRPLRARTAETIAP